jgi:DNA polymerase III epsilon subunit family exonuclease
MAQQVSLFSRVQENPQQDALGEAVALRQALPQARFVVLDLETTGLSAKRNAITEITAIVYQNGEAQEMYSTLVQPKEPIPPEVEELTGISNEMVRNAPPLVVVLNDLLQFVGQTPLLVGHNVNFDLQFLREKCRETGLLNGEAVFSNARAFCTKLLAQKVLPGLPSYEGIVVATQCGYHNNNPHRAEADVRMAGAILFALIERLQRWPEAVTPMTPPITTVQQLLTYQGLVGG